MKIEVAVNKTDTSKIRGDLLEDLSKKLLSAQSYEVIKEIRFTGVELDLLCKHKVNGKEIYVECKAYRNNIDANILKNLLGTLVYKQYSEAWLISTSEFGKEAKGFEYEWNGKPKEESSKLSFYNPARLIDALKNSGVVVPPPETELLKIVKDKNVIGDWTLLVTKYGLFWAATCLSGGIPSSVVLFYSNDGKVVEDEEILKNVALTDTTLNELNFLSIRAYKESNSAKFPKIIDVIQVQHGETWDDYRPARPEDFVGRKKELDKIFTLFSNIRKKETDTRIFALTGISGMGKSSLISKLKSKSENKHHKNKLFVFSVDVRAAVSSDYVYSAVLTCLKNAQKCGFGDQDSELRITDVSNPLSSPEIKNYIHSVEEKDQLVCLVFDQFEELYSKPELYEVFEKSKNLFFGAIALESAFCMGFAWKSDSTIPHEHPAYFMWHKLQDLRVEYKLQPFTDGECDAVLNILEKEVGEKLHSDLRHNLVVSSQGYPWLLKKLSIHIYSKLGQGANQNQLLENRLDVGKLFDDDLEKLSLSELKCLEFIANRAPIDLIEVIDVSGDSTFKTLIDKRLVVKSGDRLNIYWDIFREYLLTKKVPIIPLHYLPTNDFTSVRRIGTKLKHNERTSIKSLADEADLSENTVQNISADLVMFEIANRENGDLMLHPDVITSNEIDILKKIREKLKRHAFTIGLFKKPSNTEITIEEAIELLKEIFPNSNFTEKTWRTYSQRLCKWLEFCGLLVYTNSGWLIRDLGNVTNSIHKRLGARNRGKSQGKIFTAPASPATTLIALEWLISNRKIEKKATLPKGYRNAFVILRRFNLIEIQGNNYIPNTQKIELYDNEIEAIWAAAESDQTLTEAINLIENNPRISGPQIADELNNKYSLRWTEASKIRNGYAIRQWAEWLIKGKIKGSIPPVLGKINNNENLEFNFEYF